MSQNISIKHMVAGGIEEKGSSNIGASHHPMKVSNGTITKNILLDMGARPSNTFDKSIENPLIDIDINNLDAAFISHVHQDHVGSLIRLVKAGYQGPIYMSERSKALCRVIFDDMLKHEKEDVAEHNRKVRNLQEELQESWFIVRLKHQAPETRHIKNPHERISSKYFTITRLFQTEIEEKIWKYNVRRAKEVNMITETLYNREHNEKTTRHILEQINWDKDLDQHELMEDFLNLKKEISDSQENFTNLQYEHAKEMLKRYNIKEREDIRDLDRRMEVMQFNDTDVMQTLSQIKALSMEKAHDIFEGLLKVTFYSAGHVEGSVQSVFTVYNDKGDTRNFMFTGDLGRSKQPGLCGKPAIPKETLDYVMMEGTYGDRVHEDRFGQVDKMIAELSSAKSMTLIPCFALQRFQEITCMILDAIHTHKLKLHKGEKIYLQSPLAMGITKEYINFDKEGRYHNLNDQKHIEWITEPEQVATLLEGQGRRILVCSGGMLEKGTITQYINEINDDKYAKIILTGFQVPGTNGYKLLHNDFSEPVYLNNKSISSNQSQISTYSFSGHGDHDELLSHFMSLDMRDNATLTMVHGGKPRHVIAKDIADAYAKKNPDKKLTINVPEANGEVYEFNW